MIKQIVETRESCSLKLNQDPGSNFANRVITIKLENHLKLLPVFSL